VNLIEGYRERVRQKLLNDFSSFCRRAWREVEPTTPLSWNWHHELVAEHLMLAYQREEQRLIFCLPPRGLKSKLVSVFFPAWVWAKSPGESFILTSYSDSLSEELHMGRRNLLQSEWYQTTFPNKVQFAADQNRREKFKNTAGGQSVATSVEGVLTGLGADYLLVDDILSPQQSYSDSERMNANRFFDSTLRSRLNEPTRGVIIIVCQRLHEADLVGYLAESESGAWVVVNLPMEAEADEEIVFPVSGHVIHRKEGDLLHPQRWPKAWVDKHKRTVGRVVWSGQFQQRPSPKEGNIIKVSDVMYYGGKDLVTGERDPDLPAEFERRIISVDASFKDKATSDFVCILVIGIIGARRYVLHIVNAHLNLDGTENEIRALHAMFGGVSGILIEDKANGSAVISHLQSEIPGVIAVNPEGGKFARMMAAAPEFEAHNWFFDRTGAWTNKAVDQLCLFPNAKHDDIADAVSQAAIWLQSHSYELGVLDWAKKVKEEIRLGLRNLLGEKKPKPVPVVAEAKETRVEPKRETNPPCPVCGRTCTTRNGGKDEFLCNQCGTRFLLGGYILRPPTTEVVIGVNCCENPLPQNVSGATRCGSCGQQTAPTAQRGMSRAQYSRAHGGFMLRVNSTNRFGRFG